MSKTQYTEAHPNSPDYRHKVQVQVRASDCMKGDDGFVTLVIDARELSPGEHAVLGRLYPDLLEQAHRLLNKQLLLEAVR